MVWVCGYEKSEAASREAEAEKRVGRTADGGRPGVLWCCRTHASPFNDNDVDPLH